MKSLLQMATDRATNSKVRRSLDHIGQGLLVNDMSANYKGFYWYARARFMPSGMFPLGGIIYDAIMQDVARELPLS